MSDNLKIINEKLEEFQSDLNYLHSQVKRYEEQKHCQNKAHWYGELPTFNDDYLKGEYL